MTKQNQSKATQKFKEKQKSAANQKQFTFEVNKTHGEMKEKL